MARRPAETARIYPHDHLVVREVGLRDGLQLVAHSPSTAQKTAWIEADYRAGLRHFEVGSYVPAERFPQFVDVDDVVATVAALEGAFSATLVPNKRGAERALVGRTDEITCVLSASEQHNLSNARRTQAQGLREIAEIVELAGANERSRVITVGIAMAFGCSIAGKDAVTPRDVLDLVSACLEAGVDAVSIADTVGYANPAEVRTLVRDVRRLAGAAPVGVHFHDTRGLGIANVAAALDEGVDMVDASLGGLGGCPFAPNASGNVVLEDVLFLANSMGFPVAFDHHALAEARNIVATALPGEQLAGQALRAGPPLRANRRIEAAMP